MLGVIKGDLVAKAHGLFKEGVVILLLSLGNLHF